MGWVQADTKAIQAIHTTVVTHNPRVAVEHIGANVWKLKIRNVRREDAGAYMCQINTDPMKSKANQFYSTRFVYYSSIVLLLSQTLFAITVLISLNL